MNARTFWPEDITQWRGSRICLLGLESYTFRRNGVTVLVVEGSSGWMVTKMKGGRILDRRLVKRLPAEMRAAMTNVKTGVG